MPCVRQDANKWVIDGGEAYDRGRAASFLFPPLRMRFGNSPITTSNYAADLGNASGGMTNMAIKSGAKKFHAAACLPQHGVTLSLTVQLAEV